MSILLDIVVLISSVMVIYAVVEEEKEKEETVRFRGVGAGDAMRGQCYQRRGRGGGMRIKVLSDYIELSALSGLLSSEEIAGR